MLIGTCVVAVLYTSSPAIASPPVLSIIAEGELAVQPDQGEESATTKLIVLNPGPEVPVKVVLDAGEGAAVEVTKFTPQTARAEGATPIEVTIGGFDELDESLSGALVATGGAEPVVRLVKISPPLRPDHDWAELILIVALLAMCLLAVAVALAATVAKKGKILGKRAPGPKWSFSSWATTLTTVGAVLATVLSTVTYPETPSQIEKDTLVGMSLLFAGLVIIAPFIFQSIRRPGAPANDQEAGMWGFNLALLLACSVTFGAVLGQLSCLALLGTELIESSTWDVVMVAGVVLLALLALYYFAVTTFSLVTTDWPDLAEKAKKQAEREKRGIAVGVAGLADAGGKATVEVVPMSRPPASWSLP